MGRANRRETGSETGHLEIMVRGHCLVQVMGIGMAISPPRTPYIRLDRRLTSGTEETRIKRQGSSFPLLPPVQG